MPDDDQADVSQTNIVALPAQIKSSRCTHCHADLSYLIEEIRDGKIGRPNNCPACGTAFRPDGPITEDCLIHNKPDCLQILTGQETYCPNCGEQLVYQKQQNPEANT